MKAIGHAVRGTEKASRYLRQVSAPLSVSRWVQGYLLPADCFISPHLLFNVCVYIQSIILLVIDDSPQSNKLISSENANYSQFHKA